jgi:hypothetical protein
MPPLDPGTTRALLAGLGALTVAVLGAALAAPATPIGAVSFTVLVCGLGALAALGWPALRDAAETPWGRRAGEALALGLVTLVTWKLFAAPILDGRAGWPADFGPHHANAAILADSLAAHGRIPHFTHLVGTGDSPFELYPLPTYLLTALTAIAFHARDHMDDVIAALGVLAHLAVGLAITRLALRMAPWPLAALAGVFWITDGGSVFSGGALALLRYGMSHQLTAQAFAFWALVLGAGTVAQRSLPRSAAVWGLAGLGSATHPLGLATVLGAAAGLVVAAGLARDAKPARLVAFARDLGLGAALAAAHWAAYTARVTTLGVHYGNSVVTGWEFADQLLDATIPLETFPLVTAALLAGGLAGLVSRRWLPTMLAAGAVVLLLPYTDWGFLVPGLAPSRWSARWPAWRAAGLAKPLLCTLSAYALALLAQTPRFTRASAWSDAQRTVLGAGLALLTLLGARGLVPVMRDHARTLEEQMISEDLQDRGGWHQLVAWAKQNAPRARNPERFGRLLFLTGGEKQFPIYHLVADAGFPTTTVGIVPGVLTRERMDGMTPADLRRFNVRWVATQAEPPALGEPSTERSFGAYTVRELATWDGKVARVEEGTGEVVTRRFDAERIELAVRGADADTLVVLGVPWYPRWRATQGGRALPVYGVAARPRGVSRVLALRPRDGRVVLTCDAPLPSDGRGLGLSLAALAAALALVVVARSPRLEARLRALGVRTRDAVRPHLAPAALVLCVLGALGLAARTVRDLGAEAMAIHPATRLAPDALVEVREGTGDYRPCPYAPFAGTFECGKYGRVYGSMPQLLVDGTASWPFSVPATTVKPFKDGVSFRVTMQRRTRGTFVSAAWGRGSRTTLRIDDGDTERITATQRLFDLGPALAMRRFVVEIEPRNTVTHFGFVREESLDLDRDTDVPKPPGTRPGARGAH